MNDLGDKITDRLLPLPSSVVLTGARLAVDHTCGIVFRGKTGQPAAVRLAAMIRDEWAVNLPVTEEKGGRSFALRLASKDNPASTPLEEPPAGDEEYLLTVNAQGATITASTARGLLWGAMTLRQLIERRGNLLVVPGVKITDKPRYPLRGFQIDSGRAPNSIPKLKRIIRICSAFKLNFLLFREGDDEMNAVRYKSNNLGSSNPLSFSMEQVKALADYAACHGIDFIPEIESLGHSAAKGFHCPALVSGGIRHTYEGIGVHVRESHLAPCSPGTLQLLDSIYDEWFSSLHQPLVHLGLDEVRLPRELQERHLKELLPHVFPCAAKHGVEANPIVWGDAPATPVEYTGRVIRCLWEYGDARPIDLANSHLQKQGIEQLSAPGSMERVIMAGGSASGLTPYAKSGYRKAFFNLASWAMWGQKRANFTGLLAVQWCGNMTDLWLPDFLAAAAYGWTPPEGVPVFDQEEAKIKKHLSRLPDAARPDPGEVDRPAWNRIWLKGNEWDEDIQPSSCHPTIASG